ncbi:MAG: acyloxyacyl hydrolase [Proteobacteria bacterium]|nr:acyloxyacyl hydrolase [Pseudomonadota bacterium]
MNTVNALLISAVFFSIFVMPPASKATQAGGGYSRQLLGNTGLEQYEMFVREPLSYHTILGDAFQVSSVVEIGMAVIRETHVEHSEIGRFFIMPQLVLRPYNRIHYFFGLGAGFMGGEAEFTRHDLGGAFFLASKLGIRFLFGEGWGVECVYYHQSNAGIYNHNASLNMQQLAMFYTF